MTGTGGGTLIDDALPVPSHVARWLREVLGSEAGEHLATWMDDTSAGRATSQS